jgi:low temperature requirement protein LtrA
MAHDPTWGGVGRAMLVLAMLWWSWVGYAWLTSVVDPEEGPVRIAIFVAMAAFLVAALCVPEVFGELGLLFAGAYAVVRLAHIWLFRLASRDDPGLRKSVTGLAISTAIGVGLLTAAAFTEGAVQIGLWVLAVLLDVGGPLVAGSSGWRLAPEHFAERHGLIIIIALGESIVAIGVGAEAGVDATVVVAAVLGVALAQTLWWLYFDVVALVAANRLAEATPGKEQNQIARDSYSYLHFPMVAGVVLLALGLKKTLGHPDEHLYLVPAAALVGGVAIYLIALAAVRRRSLGGFSRTRLLGGVALLVVSPLAAQVPSIVALAVLTLLMVVLVAFEARHYADRRTAIRRDLRH